MKKSLGLIALFLCFFAAARSQPQQEKLAQPPAENWFKIVDAGRYAESWTGAAELFQKLVTQQQWANALQQFRTPLGKMENRKLKSAQYSKVLPGAPTGEYVILVYETAFEKRKTSEENITMRLEKNTWKTAGYFIK